MTWILIGVLLALAAYAAYSAKTPEGWDWKKGMAALAALGGAVWAYLSDLFHSAPPV
jgi:hypothetical protein